VISTDQQRMKALKRIDIASEGKVLDGAGLTSNERERLKALERENQELRRANELLRKGPAYNVESINEKAISRRDKILLVASNSFLYKGYSATSIDEIAEATGTSAPVLYRFFQSKQDILDNICMIGSEIMLKGVQEAINEGYDDPIDTLRHLVRNRIDFAFSSWGCQVPIAVAEFRHLSPTVAKKVDTAAEINLVEWFKYLSKIRPETPTRIILSVIHSIITQITYVGHHINELDLKEDIRAVLQRIAWQGLMS
jgi:AcrR family transcriptional regulator